MSAYSVIEPLKTASGRHLIYLSASGRTCLAFAQSKRNAAATFLIQGAAFQFTNLAPRFPVELALRPRFGPGFVLS
jgi:hypothetical protein